MRIRVTRFWWWSLKRTLTMWTQHNRQSRLIRLFISMNVINNNKQNLSGYSCHKMANKGMKLKHNLIFFLLIPTIFISKCLSVFFAFDMTFVLFFDSSNNECEQSLRCLNDWFRWFKCAIKAFMRHNWKSFIKLSLDDEINE